MLKSNSKKAIENIRAYIMRNSADYIADCAAWRGVAAPEDFPGVAHWILAAFEKEARPADLIRRGWAKTYQDAFESWGRGLAAGSLFDFLLCAARADLSEILEETPEEAARYTEEKAEKMLFSLIWRELRKA